jgi:FkbM family methyltransferase
MGIPIVLPESISKYGRDTCVIVTPKKYCIAITEKLNGLGFTNILYSHWNNPWIMEEAAKKNARIAEKRDELDRLYEGGAKQRDFVRSALSHDDKSLEVFEAKIVSNFYGCDIKNDIRLEALHEDGWYFPKGIINLSEQEVFVDCGAYDGDTVMKFVKLAGKYRYIYAFEPSPMQYELAEMRLAFDKVSNCEIFKLGLYDKEDKLRFKLNTPADGELSKDGEIIVPVTSLDIALYDKPHHPTFIKMDIEGAELKALHGAHRIIERDRPKLAISIYHEPEDPWAIHCWIKSNFPEYKIYMRQHQSINETVCYAV